MAAIGRTLHFQRAWEVWTNLPHFGTFRDSRGALKVDFIVLPYQILHWYFKGICFECACAATFWKCVFLKSTFNFLVIFYHSRTHVPFYWLHLQKYVNRKTHPCLPSEKLQKLHIHLLTKNKSKTTSPSPSAAFISTLPPTFSSSVAWLLSPRMICHQCWASLQE